MSESQETLKPVDAVAKIYISPDQLTAAILLEPPQNGGADISPQAIENAVKASNICFGVDRAILEKIKANPVYNTSQIFAKGIAPVDGINGTISYRFRTVIIPKPKVKPDGSVDYRDLGLVENVEKGQVLCDITLPERGSEGTTVTGRKITQAVGAAVPSPLGRNTKLSDDGTKVISLVNGHVVLENGIINVSDTFVVNNDVDNSTGNIKCLGSVQVFGNVIEGFLVEAAENIEIYGTVEGGFLKAGGYIKVSGGIVGKGESVIECKGDLTSTYIENSTVKTGGSIRAETIMHSSISCGKSLELVGVRAKIIGGRCIVMENIIANIIGSPANLKTELIIGYDPALIERRSVLNNDIADLQKQYGQLTQVVALLNQYAASGKLTPDKAEMLENSKLSLKVCSTRMNIKAKELESLNNRLENASAGKIICRGIMYQGVQMTIGTIRKDIRDPVECSVFTCEGDKIVVRSAV